MYDWITDAAAGLNRYWLVTADRELRRRAGERALRLIGGGSFVRELLPSIPPDVATKAKAAIKNK